MTEEILRQRLEMRERQINAVHQISAALFSKGDLDSLLRETLHVSLEIVDADAGSILLYDPARDALVFRYVIGKTELIGREIFLQQDQSGKAAEVFRTGVSLLTADAHAEGHNTRFDVDTGYQTQSLLTVPLKNPNGEPFGVLQALNKRASSFDEEDQELLEIISGLAATPIVNVHLAEEAQLAAVTRAVGHLGHDISHDLTPIQTTVDTTIETFIVPMFEDLDRLIGEWELTHPEQAQALREVIRPLRMWYPEMRAMVADGCVGIRDMVGEITDYMQGTQALYKEVVRLKEVVEERLRRLDIVARRYQVTLQYEGLDDVPPFPLDRRLIGRALSNLIHNALAAIQEAIRKEHMVPRPFHIWVRASAVPDGVFPQGNYCLIEVQDDGPGIPAHVKHTLFTARTISTTPGGTGIGTRFVKSAVEAHGGLVGVESEPPHGARFWIKLPMREDASGAALL